jgi:flagellar protein FliS
MTTELSYRKSAIDGASPIGLMIVLFDTMVGDLRRATTAIRKNDIESRCKEMNHALIVLGQLESWVDLENGGESAKTLSRFYTYLRSNIMKAAGTQSAELLNAQIDMILHVRTAWQQLDATAVQMPREQAHISAGPSIGSYETAMVEVTERIPFSQSV